MNFFDDNLVTFSTSLTADHLSLSLEALYRLDDKNGRSKHAITSILHSYCGLESAVNLIAFETFFNTDSPKYVSEDNRDILLKKFLKSWNASIPCLEKIDYLLSVSSEKLDDKVRNQLTELNNLRNWISHGFPYKTTWLIQPDETDKSKGTVLDYEHSVDWAKKFQTCKFNSLDSLDKVDAEKALRIVLNVLIKLSEVTGQIFHLVTYIDKPNYKIIHKDSKVDDILKRKTDGAST